MSTSANVVENAEIDDNGNLILIMTNGDRINAGNVTKSIPSIQELYLENSEIIVKYDDNTTKNAGHVSQLGIKDVENIYLDGYDVYAEYLDGTKKNLGNMLIESNPEIFTTYMNRDDGYMYGIRYNGEIEKIGDLTKYVGDKISENISQITSNDLEEVIIHTIDGNEYNIGKIYFNDYSSDSSLREISNVWVDPLTSTLKITYSDNTVEEAGPTSYTNINGMPIVLGDAFINEVGHLNLEILKVDDNGNFVLEEVATGFSDDGEPIYEEQFETNIIDAGLVRGNDGVDGTIYESAKIQNDGMLSFITENGIEQIAGFLTDRSVVDAYIDADGILVLKLSNGEEIKTSNVLGSDGVDGHNISSASIDADGQLSLHFEDESIPDIPAGKVDYPAEVSMNSDDEGNIIFTMSNGDTYNVGRLEGVDSKYITQLENRSDGIYALFSDMPHEWSKIGDLNIIPESVKLNPDGTLKIIFSNGQSISTSERMKGLDGDGIKSVYFDGGDLIVSRTINNRESIIQERFEDVKGIGIKDIQYNPDNHSIVFTNTKDVNSVVLLPDLKDGIGVSDVIKDGKNIIFKMDDESERVLEDVIGQGIEVETYNGEYLLFKNTATDEQYRIDTIKGDKGNSINDVFIDNDKIVLEFSDMNDITIDIPKGNNHSKTVDDVRHQEIAGEHFIVVSFVESEANSIIIPVPIPQDGDNIDNAYINSDDELVFEISNRTDPLVFPVVKGVDGNDIESITYNDANNEVIFITNNGDFPVELPDIKHGVGIDDITYDSNTSILTFSLSDSTTKNVTLPKGTDGVGISDIIYSNDKLHFLLSDENTISFPIPKGVDGDSVTNVTYENNNIIIKIENQEDVVIPFKTGIDGKTITDIYLNDRDLVIETDVLDENGNFITLTHELLQGKDAVDGVSVESFEVVNDADLRVNMDDGTFKDIEGAGKYVSNIEYKNDKLYFTYSNGTTYTSDIIKGDPGVGTGISNINVTDNNLNIEISDHSGVIDSLSHDLTSNILEKAEINNLGELELHYKDTSVKNLGKVEGTEQNWLKSASISSNDILSVVLTDGETEQTHILGNVKGETGVYANEIDIDKKSGDFTLTFSDNSTLLIGNIKDERTLSTWKSTSTPYPKDVVVIHNESMFLSVVSNNYDEPPSTRWKEFALSDNFTEILKPIIVSPNNVSISSLGATLIGQPYNGYSSKRLYREFIVYDNSGTVIFENSRNADSITLSTDTALLINETYTWKMRDVSITGFESEWSDVATFTVKEELYNPVINMDGDKSAMLLTPIINIDPVVSISTTEEVVISDVVWELTNADTGEFVKSWVYNNTDSLIIPMPILEQNTNYSIKAMVNTPQSSSKWSSPILFKTENISNGVDVTYIKKPIVGYDGGNPLDIDEDNPRFLSSFIEKGSVFNSGNYDHIPLEHITSDWEIIDVVSGINMGTYYEVPSLYEICFNNNIAANRRYRIRVRYNTKNMGSSEWSDWLEFMLDHSINKPTVYVDDTADVNNFIPDDYVYISDFVGHNTRHIKTEIQVTDSMTGELYYDASLSRYLIFDSFKFLVPRWLKNRSFNITARHISKYVISEWSEPLNIIPKNDAYSSYNWGTVYNNDSGYYMTAYNEIGIYYKISKDINYFSGINYYSSLYYNSIKIDQATHLTDELVLPHWRGDAYADLTVGDLGNKQTFIIPSNIDYNTKADTTLKISHDKKIMSLRSHPTRNLLTLDCNNKDFITLKRLHYGNVGDSNDHYELVFYIDIDNGDVFTRSTITDMSAMTIRRYTEIDGSYIFKDDLVLDLSEYPISNYGTYEQYIYFVMERYNNGDYFLLITLHGKQKHAIVNIDSSFKTYSISTLNTNAIIDLNKKQHTYSDQWRYYQPQLLNIDNTMFVFMVEEHNNRDMMALYRFEQNGNMYSTLLPSSVDLGSLTETESNITDVYTPYIFNFLIHNTRFDTVNKVMEIVFHDTYVMGGEDYIRTYKININYETGTANIETLLDSHKKLKQYDSSNFHTIAFRTITNVEGKK